MVPRRLRNLAATSLAALAVTAGLAAFASPAQAVNTRVSITDFAWSNQEPHIDLGETITWDWLGPDLQHSVTGKSVNAKQWDSNPETSIPLHRAGDSYSVTFDQPGEYFFVCKVHAFVRGTVYVSDTPGDPDSDPGPQPPINYDVEAPYLDEISQSHSKIGPKGKGMALKFSSNERGSADADYYQLVKRGKRTVKKFRGYTQWPSVTVGYNTVNFAARSATFKAKPGKYEALFRVTDEHHNITDPIPFRFEIKGPAKKKPKPKKSKKPKKGSKRR